MGNGAFHDHEAAEKFLVAPADEGGLIYRTPAAIVNELLRLEEHFTPAVGGPVLFDDVAEGKLTPFAARLFHKGYVSVEPIDASGRVFAITALHHEIEARLRKTLGEDDSAAGPADDLVIPEADLPFEGPLAAVPDGLGGEGPAPHVFGVKPGDHPAEILENLLYGHTEKDDPEGSHHGEHEISDGIDKS